MSIKIGDLYAHRWCYCSPTVYRYVGETRTKKSFIFEYVPTLEKYKDCSIIDKDWLVNNPPNPRGQTIKIAKSRFGNDFKDFTFKGDYYAVVNVNEEFRYCEY